MEPLGMQQGNSGIGAQRASATYETKLPALQRREDFARAHPEIDIRAKREDGQMRFYVHEPGHPGPGVWTDPGQMMDDLENRYPAAGQAEPDPAALRRTLVRSLLKARNATADPATRGLITAQLDSLRTGCPHQQTSPLLGTARQCTDCLTVLTVLTEPAPQPDQ